MAVTVLVLGLVAAGAGVLTIGFGIPIHQAALGQTLIIAGAAVLSGGLISVGLAAVLRQLSDLVEALRTRPQARPAHPPEPQPRADELRQRSGPQPPRVEFPPRPEPLPARVAPPPRSARPAEPRPAEPRLPELPANGPASAAPRQHPSVPRPERVVPDAGEVPLSPNAVAGPAAPEPAPEIPLTAPSRPVEAQTVREPRLDFLFRSRPARAAPPESFESLWPKGQGRQSDKPPSGDSAPALPEAKTDSPETPAVTEIKSPPERPAPPPPLPEERVPAILKSGVVDGMAYTLYTDGSIEAQLPQGTVRFGSITELRAHIESNS